MNNESMENERLMEFEQELKDTRTELKRKKRELDVANVKLKKYRNFVRSVRDKIIENLNHEAHQLDEEIKEITISSKRYVQE